MIRVALAVAVAVIAVLSAFAGWWAATALALPLSVIVLVTARLRMGRRISSAATQPADPPTSSWRPGPRVSGALTWAAASARLYDRATRPVLQRALDAACRQAGIDLASPVGRHRVQQQLGSRLWFLLDPARAPRDDDGPGVDHATLAALITAIEKLNR